MDKLVPETVEAIKELERFFEEKNVRCVLIGAGVDFCSCASSTRRLFVSDKGYCFIAVF